MNKNQNEAFKPLTRKDSDEVIESRLEGRAAQADIWTEKWAEYSELLTARDLMSALVRSTCSASFANSCFLPDDEIIYLVEWADVLESIDMVEFVISLEELFEIKISNEFAQKSARYPYHRFLKEVLALGGSKTTDLVKKAFEPIKAKTSTRDIKFRLELREKFPDLWAEFWPNEPGLLAVRDRLSRIIRGYGSWPNDRFLPDDYFDLLIWPDTDSLDLVEITMEFEETFKINVPDKNIIQFFQPKSSYREFLEKLLAMTSQAVELSDYVWTPLSLPPGYHQQSFLNRVRRFFLCDTNNLEHRRLRFAQARRPAAWTKQWPDNQILTDIRDRVSHILICHLGWLDGSFIPQDRLDALFHSRWGLRHISWVLKEINHKFDSNISIDFITSGQHTYEDLLKRLGGLDPDSNTS